MPYSVYILSNHHRTVLYIGVTNDLERRLHEHRSGVGSAFASKYRARDVVHIESFDAVRDAIAREKQLKGWSRAKKLALVRRDNPELESLG
jgi:predicted GIY-YIG superfamily endonuclease